MADHLLSFLGTVPTLRDCGGDRGARACHLPNEGRGPSLLGASGYSDHRNDDLCPGPATGQQPAGHPVDGSSAPFQEAHSPAAKEKFPDCSYLRRHACEQRLECSKSRGLMGRKGFFPSFFQKKKPSMLFLCCFSHQK